MARRNLKAGMNRFEGFGLQAFSQDDGFGKRYGGCNIWRQKLNNQESRY